MKFLGVQQRMLHLVGYSFRPNEHSAWKWFAHLGLYLLTAHLVPESYYIFDNLTDISKTTEGMCPFLVGLSTIIKLFTLLLGRQRFYEVIWKIKELTMAGNYYRDANWRNRIFIVYCFLVTGDDRQILESAYKIANRLNLPHIVSTIMVAVLYIVFPIAMGSYGYFRLGEGSWAMPMRSK